MHTISSRVQSLAKLVTDMAYEWGGAWGKVGNLYLDSWLKKGAHEPKKEVVKFLRILYFSTSPGFAAAWDTGCAGVAAATTKSHMCWTNECLHNTP